MGFFNLSSNKAWGAIKSTLKESSVVREMLGAKGLSNKLAAGAKAVSRLPAPARSGLVGAGIGAGAGALRAGSNDDGPLGFAGNVAAGAAVGAGAGFLLGGGRFPKGPGGPGAAGQRFGAAAQGFRSRVAAGAYVHAGQVPADFEKARIFSKTFMNGVREGWRT